ncbi:hypothetical protein J4466_02010 [Candidatus Pacearchaeota archaeon]|nr:hypothetical protein [Candidatus Pacearchaeota archaeon]
MKLELYSTPNCEEAEKFKEFLIKNNLPFREIITNTPIKDSKIPKNPFFHEKEHTLLKITYSSSIHALKWYDEFQLNQSILEHIKIYNAHVKTWN